jgi:hypothetical protein
MGIADYVKSARIGVLPPRPNLRDLGEVSANASVSLERTVLDEVLRYYVEVGTGTFTARLRTRFTEFTASRVLALTCRRTSPT